MFHFTKQIWTHDERPQMIILLFLILFVLCWPLALLALMLYPLIWLLSLPFRLVGIAVEGAFELLRAILLLPSRLLKAR
jgi:hypothetical protein